MDDFTFQVPDDAPPDVAAVAELGASLHQLANAVTDLHGQHLELRDTVAARLTPGGPRKAPESIPWPLRFHELDRDAAAQVWPWLIEWVGWLVERYQLAEEIPRCWYLHPPLVEELSALAAGWFTAYDDAARGDEPLIWHERFARARARLRDWDDYTRCRNGTHTDRRLDLAWPDDWSDDAYTYADADVSTRLAAPPADTPVQGGTS